MDEVEKVLKLHSLESSPTLSLQKLYNDTETYLSMKSLTSNFLDIPMKACPFIVCYSGGASYLHFYISIFRKEKKIYGPRDVLSV